MKQLKSSITLASSIAFSVGCLALNSSAAAAITEEMVISADFQPVSVLSTANSVSVMTEEEISKFQAESLADVLSLAPNLNYSSGASRGKFFQIRGVGARSQFVDPINPGVGLLVDGIDFSTLGGSATLIDIASIEVLRGPQGTRYGANALGGLINLQSNQPTEEFEGNLTASFGDIESNQGSFDSWRLGAVISGPLQENLLGRFAIEQVTSDGYIDNVYLNSDNTNNIDELTARGKLNWQASDRLSLNFTGLLLDIDNGYDVFTLTNILDSESDQPGRDSQETVAFGVESRYQLDDQIELVTNFSFADSEGEYSYDEDWHNQTICDGFVECYGYSGFDQYLRDTTTQTVDLRLVASQSMFDWVAGIYLRDQEFKLNRDETFSGTFQSRYETTNIALYGQATWPLSDTTRFSAGLRLEDFDAQYSDTVIDEAFEPGESLWGGHLSLEHDLDEQSMIYLRIARGYKSGGANSDGSFEFPDELKTYDTEHLVNYEIGFKGLSEDGTLMAQISLFYQDRTDAQIKQSFVLLPCPCTGFADYNANAPEASSYGVEAELQLQATDNLNLFLNLGLLNAEFDQYSSFSHVEADLENGIPFDLEGRDIAQSPNYQYSTGFDWRITENVNLWAAYEGKGSYLFSNRHNAQSDSYNLLNARISYEMEALSLSLWGKNLTNELYRTRGFGSFGNDPRDGYVTNNYYQFGNPREVGVSGTYKF